MGEYVQPEWEELAAEGSAVLLAGLGSENWKQVRDAFAAWLAVSGQPFYASDLADIEERQTEPARRRGLVERRWRRRLAEALVEAPAGSAVEAELRALVGQFTLPAPRRRPAPAEDHIDFRQGTFHGPVIGVQHNYVHQRPGGALSDPDSWPHVRDADPVTLGVRAGRRTGTEGESALPPYVRRDADRTGDGILGDDALIVITGGRLSGKTRTAWEYLCRPLVLPEDTRVHAPAPGTDLRSLPALLHGREGSYVLWLDELEGHLGEHGLDAALLSQLAALRVQVLATMRDDLYDEHRFGGGPASRVLSRAATVELDSRWSPAELGRLKQAAAADARLADAVRWRGEHSLPEYLAVGPELRDLWRRAARPGGPHPRGHLLVRAAIDLALCGVGGDIPGALLEKVCGAYGAEASAEAEREPVAEAFAWAAERRHGVTGLLVGGEQGPWGRYGALVGGAEDKWAWRAYGSLVADAVRDSRLPDVPVAVWRCALEGTGDDAYVHRRVRTVLRAVFDPRAETGDLDAMHMMGLLSEDAQDEATALDWFRRAADAGKTELSGRVGELLFRRGETGQALPYLRTAAEHDPTGHEVRLLGEAHLMLAERWLGQAADRGDADAAHQLGDVHLGRGDIDRAAYYYLKAEQRGHAPVARSAGLLALLRCEEETAEVYLRRAADAGDVAAADLLALTRSMSGTSQSLEGARTGFQESIELLPLSSAHLGAVLEKQGLLDEARTQYEKAYHLGDPYGAYRLAVLLHRQGAPEEAAAWSRKATDLGHPAAPPDTVRE
ncbi:tetratricopeptide repeat protein [Streptomyces sp. SID13726]|uniref:tetratricopeptide repeat protein n=1 Tax=Streptomyces sp. SID13726 TaxID=2706058 RepID=UPI0013BDCD3A|nr:tetratricopeptide repeat protein [Streptomyces sp. SID13726]NEB03238.1 tetratricopeptide repeat protein [Streptomyces sp. SID13726]